MYQTIDQYINEFEAISLGEMDKVALMNRTDTKFLLKIEHLAPILSEIQGDYYCLAVNDVRRSPYESVYLDTEGFRFYHDHHKGKRGRAKVRLRKYVQSDLSFLEIKLKDKKGRTVKSRKKVDDFGDWKLPQYEQFIDKKVNLESDLLASLDCSFERITLVSKLMNERVTIDLDLTFEKDSKTKALGDLVIIEVKQDGIDRSSKIMQALKKSRHRSYSISKYCVGLALLNDDLKKNGFKEKLLKINKITN